MIAHSAHSSIGKPYLVLIASNDLESSTFLHVPPGGAASSPEP